MSEIEEENYWANFTDVMMAFSLVLLLMLASLVIVSPDDPVTRIIKKGHAETVNSIEKSFMSETSFSYNYRADGGNQIFSFSSNVLFSTAEFELNKKGKAALLLFLKSIKSYQNVVFDLDTEAGYFTEIKIDGHTDRVPVKGSLISNWHLSSLRAISVLQFFEKNGIDPMIMSATGYADTKPVSIDNSMNRRVEITLIYSPEKIKEKIEQFL